jgi:hypothetical protein
VKATKFIDPRTYLNDSIQLFIEYDKQQGSSRAHNYYTVINKAINQYLFGCDSVKELSLTVIDKMNHHRVQIQAGMILRSKVTLGEDRYKDICKSLSTDIKAVKLTRSVYAFS